MAAEHAHSHPHPHDHGHGHADAHAHPSYEKTWAILLALLVVSVAGPFFGHPIITLITAFGIAVVKAYLVITRFMHLSLEKRYIFYMVTTCLVFMFLFFAGASPDVMKESGSQWAKPNYHTQIPRDEPGHGEHAQE